MGNSQGQQQHDPSLDGINDDDLEIVTSGVGYVSHIKDFPEDGDKEAALFCNIAALRGTKADLYKTFYNCRVDDEEAQRVIRRCVGADKDGRRIVIRFHLSNEYADTYLAQKGKRRGQASAVIKACLVHVETVDIEGERVYPEPAPPPSNGKSRAKDSSRSRAVHT